MKESGIEKALLLGTRYNMEQQFYTSFMTAAGIQPVIPEEKERIEINRVIFEELYLGDIGRKPSIFSFCHTKISETGAC